LTSEQLAFKIAYMSDLHPKPPQLQPIPLARHNRFWPILSHGLMVLGAALLFMGGWQLYGYYNELNHPPAPIIDSQTAFATKSTITMPPTPTPPPATMTKAIDTATPITPTFTLAATPIATRTPSPLSELLTEIDFSRNAHPELMPQETPKATPTAVTAAPITRIIAPSIDLDAPVIEVGWVTWTVDGKPQNVWQVADYAIGWHKNSALPGQGGNIVLSGHNNVNGELFRYTLNLAVGDKITLYEGNQAYQYHVTEKFIVKDLDEPEEVRRANARWIGPFDEERLTLVTCWPYIGNTHRAIVIAKP